MALYKTEGLIYKIKNMHDSNKLVWILSKDKGKINSIAKGVKKISSKRAGHIDIFNHNKFTFYKGRNLDILTETSSIKSYENIKKKFVFETFYLAELIDSIIVEPSESNKILNYLLVIYDNATESNFIKLLAFFEIKLLQTLGFEPNLHTFLDTNSALKIEDEIYFSNTTPGFLSFGEKEFLVNPNTIKCQRFFLNNFIYETLKLDIEKKTLKQISRINKIWLQTVIDKKLKSLQFVKT
ncbi:DNA repair protein RecO [Candidatus Dojkabacteria bacterium]|nr:DNA repair protein RecO [Candidatus Dojkabacteria bacterium]